VETGRGSFGGERGGDILPGNFPLEKEKKVFTEWKIVPDPFHASSY